MTTREQNIALTRTGAGAAAGRLLRQYWQPVATSDEVSADSGPKIVKVMGEELVLFRDEQGRAGLLAKHCAHRGADLSFGRIEAGGLRCLYHGWVFDVAGQCLEQPAEPRAAAFCQRVKQQAYPLREAGGIIFAYLGDGEPPALPKLECLSAPADHRFMWKFRERCNYLQGLEGDIDPFHLNFLHRAMDNSHAKAAPGSSDQYFDFYMHGTPRLEVERTGYGLRIYALRQLEERAYLRVTNFLMPNVAIVAGPTGEDGYTILWHVPIDDESHMKYMLNFRRSKPVNAEIMQKIYDLHVVPGSDLETWRNRENRWKQDRAEMKDGWFAGMGPSFSVHDNFVSESMGPIFDRSNENLGYTDKAIVAARRLILTGIENMASGATLVGRTSDANSRILDDMVVTSEILDDPAKFRYEALIED
jgi:phthalate 4,5-dioxygenase oxygenase subunit